MRRSEVKACEACKSSKRKCTKQLPRCRRCELRGLNCAYESRPRMVVYQADSAGTLSRVTQIHRDQQPQYSQCDVLPAETDPNYPQLELSLPITQSYLSLDDLRSAWFLTPDAWKNSPIDTTNFSPLCTSMIHRYLDKTKDWLREWITTGSNPFIHTKLYSNGMPDCVQDAFMALSTYFSKTEKTADMINRLMEEKADKFVASQTTGVQGSTLDDIARVQALLIYCVIRLLNGDLRQRHLAEQHLPILHDWTRDMLSNAATNDNLLLRNTLTDYIPQFTTDPAIPCQVSPEQLLWHAWILSESVRRTWCVSMAVQSSYELLKTGTGPCYGGVLVTTRKGVWEAETAFAWTRMCAERSVGFVHRNESEKVMGEMRVDEVDVFALALMEVDVGSERMERWRAGET
ncbi:hypothetical protein ACJ41O_014366 [Fusarium nematophilum]